MSITYSEGEQPMDPVEYLVMGVNPNLVRITDDQKLQQAAGKLATRNNDAGLGSESPPSTTLDRHPVYDNRFIVE